MGALLVWTVIALVIGVIANFIVSNMWLALIGVLICLVDFAIIFSGVDKKWAYIVFGILSIAFTGIAGGILMIIYGNKFCDEI